MLIYARKAVENGKVIFPKKFCLLSSEKGDRKVESIEQLKLDLLPSEFAALYLNDPVDSDAIEFKPAWFQPWVKTFEGPVATIMSIDPAFRLKQTNDFTGITISKIRQDGSVVVVEAQQKKLNANDLINHLFVLVEIYKPDRVILETVAAQIVLLDLIHNKMKETGKWFVVEEAKLDTSETKAMRIRSLIPFYANQRIFHVPGLKELENQLLEFPRGLHDDIIDSLAHQVKFWKAVNQLASTPKIQHGSLAWWKSLVKKPQSNNEKLFSDFRG